MSKPQFAEPTPGELVRMLGMDHASVQQDRGAEQNGAPRGGTARGVLNAVAGVAAGLLAYLGCDLSSASWLSRDPLQRPVAALVGAALVVGLSVLLVWARPRAGLVAGICVAGLFMAGQLLWDGRYGDFDVWALDPVSFLAFGSQQILTVGTATALILGSSVGLKRRS